MSDLLKTYFIFLGFSTMLLACGKNEPVEQVWSFSSRSFAPVDSVISSQAGEDVFINLSAPLTDQSQSQYLLLESHFDTRILNVGRYRISDKAIKIPGDHFSGAGVYRVYSVPAIGGKPALTIHVAPGSPLGLIETFAGPKTIVASSAQRSLVLGVLKDRFGNPIYDSSTMEYLIQYPNDLLLGEKSNLNHLAFPLEVEAISEAGKINVGATFGEANTKEEVIEVVPGWPKDFRIFENNYIPFADTRQFFQVKSDLILDANENIVSDGTLVTFYVSEKDVVVGVYKSFTISGIASVWIRNPAGETTWEISAGIYGNTNPNRISLQFRNSVEEIKLNYNLAKRVIVIGPVVNQLGNIVADGFQARIILLRESGKKIIEDVVLQDGKYTVQFPHAWRDIDLQCTVICGGTSNLINVNLDK